MRFAAGIGCSIGCVAAKPCGVSESLLCASGKIYRGPGIDRQMKDGECVSENMYLGENAAASHYTRGCHCMGCICCRRCCRQEANSSRLRTYRPQMPTHNPPGNTRQASKSQATAYIAEPISTLAAYQQPRSPASLPSPSIRCLVHDSKVFGMAASSVHTIPVGELGLLARDIC